MGADNVHEDYVQAATTIAQQKLEHIHANVVQLGHALQYFDREIRALKAKAGIGINPVAERERMGRRINRMVRRLAFEIYDKNFQDAYVKEIIQPFGERLEVILNTWSVDRIRDIDDRLERRIIQVFRNG